mmetsp:Transcript_45001/g.59704  ORF Transcript_45001/g.59704 Transcript_45001/m.59704 type:complete len:199 (+) Transcript_45001:591-1187(+)
MQDKEIERAYKEAARAENLVKYRDEIMSRPKTEWHKSFKQKKDLQKESKRDLKTMGAKFDESLTEQSKQQKLRDKKQKRKEEERLQKAAASSMFGADKEARAKKEKGASKGGFQQQEREPAFKDRDTLAKEARKFRGKRNSLGAKMAKFRGGARDFKKSGGGIGDRDLSGKSKGMQHARGGFAPVKEEPRQPKPKKGD